MIINAIKKLRNQKIIHKNNRGNFTRTKYNIYTTGNLNETWNMFKVVMLKAADRIVDMVE